MIKNSDSITFDLENYQKTKLLFDSIFRWQKGLTPYELILIGGAVKGGKSFGGMGCLMIAANTFPKSRFVIVRKTNKVIERNLLPTWQKIEWICDSNQKLKRIEGDYHKYFNNGSEIILMAENYQNDKELNAFKGLDINGWLADEMNELNKATYQILTVRNGTNRHTCDIPPIAMATCNPTFGWLKREIYDRFLQREKPGQAAKDILPAPDEWLFIPSTAHDNPAIPKDQFDIWRRTMTPYDYHVFIEGNWGVETKIGSFLKSFDPNKNLTPKTLRNDLPLHITFDENVLPYITCALWQIDIEQKEVIQMAELPMRPPNNSAKKTGIALRNYLNDNGYNNKIFIYGDATSKKNSTLGESFYNQILAELSKFHFEKRILKRNESVSLTGVFVNDMFSGHYLWKVLINENCGYSISDFVETLEDENGGIKKVRITESDTGLSYEKNGHFVDSMRYFLVAVFWDLYFSFKKKRI